MLGCDEVSTESDIIDILIYLHKYIEFNNIPIQ